MNGNGRFFLDIDQNNLWLGIGAAANWDFAEGIYKTKAAKLKSEASQYRTVIEREKALLESVSAYYDLMGAQLNLGAYNNLLSQSEIIVQQIEIQVDAGLRFTSELLLAKSNKNHLAIAALSAKRDLNNASAKLLQLLNLDQNVTLLSVDSTLVPLEDSGEEITTSMNDYQRRPEIKALALDLEALKVASKIYTTGLLLPELHLDLNGSSFGRFNGNVNPIDPVTNPDPNQLYPTSAFAGSLLWRVPLGALIQKGDTKKAESLIRLKEIEAEQCKAQINEEVSRALSVLAVGREQILMAKEALDLSSEALSQSMERQRLGTAKPFEVFQAQQFYLQAEIDYIEVVGEYNKGWFAWRVAKGIGL
jgi:outer membrane protein TolC